MTDWSSKTVEQLKIELRSRGLGVSGNKSILVERLAMSEKKSEILEAEISSDGKNASNGALRRGLANLYKRKSNQVPAKAIFLASIMIIGTAGGGIIFGEGIAKWAKGSPEYVIIDFDSNQSRAYAQGLVALLSLIHI